MKLIAATPKPKLIADCKALSLEHWTLKLIATLKLIVALKLIADCKALSLKHWTSKRIVAGGWKEWYVFCRLHDQHTRPKLDPPRQRATAFQLQLTAELGVVRL